MPAKIIKKKSGKFEVKTPNAVHAKSTTKAKAMAQKRLLNAVDHGWHPTKAYASKPVLANVKIK